jgi:hypothetical protein
MSETNNKNRINKKGFLETGEGGNVTLSAASRLQ